MPIPRKIALLAATCLAAASVAGAPPAYAEEEVEACGLRPSAHLSPLNEWASCLSASVNLLRLPALGDTAELAFDLTAQFERSSVRVEVDLAGALAWVTPPAGFETVAVPSNAPDDLGGLLRASGTISLAGGETRGFTGTVRAV